MSCCNSCYSTPCCCPEETTTTTTTTTCANGEPCVEAYQSDCVIYSGDDLECYGIIAGMTVTEILQILINLLPGCPCHCYIVPGGGPSSLVYPVTYVDCDGVEQSTSTVPGEDLAFCAQEGTVVTQAEVTDNGLCTGDCPSLCTSFTLTSTGVAEIQYIPCYGSRTVNITFDGEITICTLYGIYTVITGNITASAPGSCY